MGAQVFRAPTGRGRQGSRQSTHESIQDRILPRSSGGWIVSDANHFLYLCKANQLASVDPTKIKVPTLVLYAPNDLIFYEAIVEDTIQKIAGAGTSVESGTLTGPNGHLNGIAQIGQGANKIGAFLAE